MALLLKRISGILALLEEFAVGALFIAMLVFGLAAIISRYLLNISLPWPEEVNRLSLIWLTFLGASIATRLRTDIRFVSNITIALPGKMRIAVEVLLDLISIAFLLALTYYSWRFLSLTGWNTLISLRSVPIGLFTAAVPVMSAVMAVHVLIQFIERLAERAA